MSEERMELRFETTERPPQEMVSKGGVQGRVVWALESEGDGPALVGLADQEEPDVREALARTSFRPKPGKVQELHLRSVEGPLYVAGLGEPGALDPERLRRAAGAIQGRTRDAGITELGLCLPGELEPAEEGRALAEGLYLSTYRFTRYLSSDEARRRTSGRLARVLIASGQRGEAVQAGIGRGLLTARAVAYARDLVNTPSVDKKPEALAERAEALAGERIQVEIWDEAKIQAEGMGAFLGVAAGSEAPPRLIHLTYEPEGEPIRRLAVVGKGVTFDSGGLSLKPPASMENMKVDMAGAAAVMALFSVLPELAPPVRVHGIIAATENMPSGSATRPGDVLHSMRGKTIEVLNTDAEGRLTLADALTFACRQKVDEIVDLATLTGACVVALGQASGLWGRPESFRDRLLAAARAAGDRTWPMPLVDDYRERLRSTVADVKNIAGRWGGAITAALFLEEFVDEDVGWCHLDIAGSASTDEEQPTCPKGATGAGVGTLIRYVESL